MTFIVHAESLRKIAFGLQICIFSFFSIKTVVFVSLKIAYLDQGVLGRLFFKTCGY